MVFTVTKQKWWRPSNAFAPGGHWHVQAAQPVGGGGTARHDELEIAQKAATTGLVAARAAVPQPVVAINIEI
jgi:hypothetical protein